MFKNISIKARLSFVIGLLSVLLVVIGTMGLRGMHSADEKLATVYLDRLIPTGQISTIDSLMLENILQLNLAAMHDPRREESALHDHPLTLHTDAVSRNIETITGIWSEFMQTYLTPEEAQFAQEFAETRGAFVQEGLLPVIQLLTRGEFRDANIHITDVTRPAYQRANESVDKLLQLQLDVAEAE